MHKIGFSGVGNAFCVRRNMGVGCYLVPTFSQQPMTTFVCFPHLSSLIVSWNLVAVPAGKASCHWATELAGFTRFCWQCRWPPTSSNNDQAVCFTPGCDPYATMWDGGVCAASYALASSPCQHLLPVGSLSYYYYHLNLSVLNYLPPPTPTPTPGCSRQLTWSLRDDYFNKYLLKSEWMNGWMNSVSCHEVLDFSSSKP